MKFNNKKNECVTTTEGKEIWVSRSVAVTLTCIALYKGEFYVLISKRGPDCPDNVGKWCLPCGYLDWNETGVEAVMREAWEEVGLDLSPWIYDDEQPWYVNTDPSENRQNISLRYGMFINIGYEELPVLIPNNEGEGREVDDAIWMPIRDIDSYDFAFNHCQSIKDFYMISQYGPGQNGMRYKKVVE